MKTNNRISAKQAYTAMTRNPNCIVLDVRSGAEYMARHIPGATHLSDYDIKYMAAEVLPNCEALILVYCQSGGRSRGAAGLLTSMGYTNVYDFGGINSWPYETVRN